MDKRLQYQCLRCSKVDRRGRIIAHVLKHHVSFDGVPYSCSLCNFRCLEAADLAKHTRRYKRHLDEAKNRHPADVAAMLHKSNNPIVIGDKHMRPLQRGTEEVIDDPEDESIFDQQDDEAELPAWLIEETSRSSLTPFRRASSANRASATRGMLNAGVQPPSQAAGMARFKVDQQPDQTTSPQFLAMRTESGVVQSTAVGPSASKFRRCAPDVTNQFDELTELLFPTAQPAAQQGQSTGMLTPHGPKKADKLHNTPLQDEYILPSLLRAAEATDPLAVETGCTTATPTPADPTSLIASAIKDAAASIVAAIETHARATREQVKATDRMTDEMARMERRLAGIEKSRSAPAPVKGRGRSRSPAVRSTVTKMK